jgi:hypothetical protein
VLSRAQQFLQAVEAAARSADQALVPVDLGGTLGVVYVRPMSAQAFYDYVDTAKAARDELPARRQARTFIEHARDEHGALMYAERQAEPAIDELVRLPFGVLQTFSQEMLRINGLLKKDTAEEKND